ncbi:protein Shroom1 isoform 2 [Mus musculus]|uniref:Isoform 2 of Protein Shroom1 n=1 Tax=Mus musculus TaxID=10090 RepID=Q5SX79-2|nr:protein Shroom1 isoform 2 [Mus musculus]AAH05761.1 Shroom1 protein [Mus musculus]AAH31598.1 Shroom1 protein [Mus musculus]|eukprot:NP_001277718.1 protein Shroom1 isoform 2 [Mus musculus]
MEALGTGRDRTSQASATESLDLRRLSTRADSAYSSFSTASGDPETRTPSPGTERLPYLDWDYVRVVWGSQSPTSKDAVLSTTQRPVQAVAGHSDPRSPEVQGSPGPLNRQDTPLLYALAAEAEATAHTAEPPSPPASRDAYRQRLQGAQRRVLRETSFQRKEFRMSLPGRLRPAVPTRLPTAHVRSASSSQELGEEEPARTAVPALAAAGRGRLSSQQRQCCFSEPGKLHRVGWSGGPTGEDLRKDYSTQELQRGMHAKSKGLLETQSLSSTELNSGPADLGNAHRPAGRSQSVSGEVMGPCKGSERTVATVQAVPQRADIRRPLLHTKLSSTSYRQYENDLSKKAGQIAVSAERPLHETPGITGTEDCGQAVNGSVDLSRPTSIPETTNDDIPTFDTNGTTDPSAATEKKPLKPPPVDVLRPSDSETPGSPHHTSLTWGQFDSKTTWPSRHFEALVQELARLDPSLSRTLAAQPGPEPPQGLLDGLFPVEEIRSAMRPALEEMGEKAAGASEEGSCGHHLTQDLQTSQEASRSENSTPDPDQSSGQEFPEGNSTQAKKVELARLLQKMLQDLHAEQERLRGTAADWTQRNGALEAAVSQACTPRELERFRRFMTDLERVLGLLLLLGSRLVRVNLALARAGSNSDPDERASLLQRLQLLQRQQEEAKELKEHVARREQTLRQVLERELPAEHLRSYCVLLASKARILSQQRSLDDRIRFLKDQLDTIWSDLSHHPLSPRLTWAPAIRPLNKQPFLATLI